jgi:sporulation protein YlmC with PRC-barrel domain
MNTIYDHTVLSADTLIGDKVRNSAGEELGEIEEIMFDVDNGRIAYAVLSFGGFMGLGDKLFAIPWPALTLNKEEKCFYLNIEQEQLETAPGFDKNNWPDMANADFRTTIYNYYNSTPYWNN